MIKSVKILSGVFFLCSLFTSAHAQRMKYRDLAPALDSLSAGQQMSMLWEYLLEEPNHANASYRIAMIHYNQWRNADPLLAYRKAMAHAKEAQLRLLRAKLIVTPQDVRSDNEYYAPFFKTVDSKGKPYVEFPFVSQKITNAYDSVMKFQEKMPLIYKAFTKSVAHYDKAVKVFAATNTEYKTLEDIYMFYGKDLEQRFDELKNAYDSSIAYFQQYKSLTDEYPLPKYNQQTHIKNIAVYRMDGLITRLNFLTPVIELWNYSAWVDGVRKKHSEEIAGLKEKIEKSEASISSSIKELEKGGVIQDKQPPKLSKDIVFELNNYDKNSLALALLEYKTYKQSWLFKLINASRDSTLDAKLLLYSQLIQMNRAADSLNFRLKSTVQPHSVKKHHAFLDKYYGGGPGLEKFLKDENEWIQKTFNEYQEILKGNLLQYSASDDQPNKFVKFGAFNVPLFVEKKSIAQLDNVSLLTQKLTRNADGSMYITGVHKTNKKTGNNATGFVARLNPDGKPAWLKELNFAPDSLPALNADNYIGDMVATQEGCAVVVTSVRPNSIQMANTFVFLNDKGEMKTFRMKDPGMARKLIYQETSNSFIMVFKGDEEKQVFDKPEPISISSINALGDLLWHQDILLSGTIQDVLTVRDGYLLTGNFTAIRDQSGREVRTRVAQGQSNPYLIKLDLRGNIVNISPVVSDKSIFIDRVVKVNDGSINLLGYESTFQTMDDPAAEKGNIMHMMTTYDLKRVCSNF